MKTVLLGVLVAYLVSGCSLMNKYLGPSKMTVCIGESDMECPQEFMEVDGKVVTNLLPVGSSTVGTVEDLVTTCVDYSEGNVTCPSGSKTLVLDFIK